MTSPASRANRLLGLCVLAALCGCAALHEPRRDERASAETPAHSVMPAAPTTPAETHEQAPHEAPAQVFPHTPAEPQSLRMIELLRYAEQYAGMSPEAQHQTIAEAETRYNVEQTSFSLLRYALLLSLSEPDRQTDAGTVARLRDLLARPVVGDDDKDVIPFAQLLAHVLDEREHLLVQNAELQRKLNQLKAIEQQLGDRVEPPQAAP